MAAAVGIGAVERAAVEPFVVLDRRLGSLQGHLDPIPFCEAVAEFERLGKLVARFEVEDVRFRGHCGQPVDDRAALGPEGGGHRESVAKPFGRPADDLRRPGGFEGRAGRGQFLEQAGRGLSGLRWCCVVTRHDTLNHRGFFGIYRP